MLGKGRRHRHEKKSSVKEGASSVTWKTLEQFARVQIQEYVQRLLEEEVTELLGRRKSQRRPDVDGSRAWRNGYGKPRGLGTTMGSIQVRRPRVRGSDGRFESRILPLFKRRTQELGKLLRKLYLKDLEVVYLWVDGI
jgi:putative transposase